MLDTNDEIAWGNEYSRISSEKKKLEDELFEKAKADRAAGLRLNLSEEDARRLEEFRESFYDNLSKKG